MSPLLSADAKTAQILPKLSSSSLISLGQLCDDDYLVVLHKKVLLAIKDKEIILRGIRNPVDRLWDIPVSKNNITDDNYPIPHTHPGLYASRTETPAQKHTANIIRPSIAPLHIFKEHLSTFTEIIDHNILDNMIQKAATQNNKTYMKANLVKTIPSIAVIIKKKQTHTDLAAYLHASCFSPVRSTFSKAISKQFFKTWPGLTPTLINKYLPQVVATTQGHIHQERQNLQSTKFGEDPTANIDKIRKRLRKLQALKTNGKTLEDVLTEELHTDNFPTSPTPNVLTNEVAYMLLDRKEFSTAYTDLTGRFPMRSSRGN